MPEHWCEARTDVEKSRVYEGVNRVKSGKEEEGWFT